MYFVTVGVPYARAYSNATVQYHATKDTVLNSNASSRGTSSASRSAVDGSLYVDDCLDSISVIVVLKIR